MPCSIFNLFKPSGTLERTSGKVSARGDLPPEVGLYAFVIKNDIKYIGIAEKGIRKRMNQYAARQKEVGSGKHPKSKSIRPVHQEIADALRKNDQIEIYAFVPPPEVGKTLEWNGFPIHFLIGLEAGLILQLHPEWNRRGRTKIAMELPSPLSDENSSDRPDASNRSGTGVGRTAI